MGSILLAWNAAEEEILFAIRQPKGPHWYENFGHGIVDRNQPVYGKRGRLCKLNLETGQSTLLLDDSEGGSKICSARDLKFGQGVRVRARYAGPPLF